MAVRRSILLEKVWFLLVPLLGSPLLFFGKEFQCLYVIWVTGNYLVSNAIPLAITCLLPIFFFPIFNIVSAQSITEAYFKDGGVLFATTFIMAMAVEETNLHRRVALSLLRISGPRRQLILMNFMIATTFISLFLSDSAATALMIPIAIAVLETLDEANGDSSSVDSENQMERKTFSLENMSSADKGFSKALLLACAHSSTIGGTAILTGTPANLLLGDQLTEFYPKYDGISYLEWLCFSFPFQPVFLIVDYIVLTCCCIGYKQLFWRKKEEEKDDEKNKMMVRTLKKSYDRLGPISFGEISLMFWFVIVTLSWIFRRPGFIPGWSNLLPMNGKNVSDTTIAILIASLMFIWPKDPFHDELLAPILTWDSMKRKFAWPILLYIGFASALSLGVKNSGLGKLVACSIGDSFGSSHMLLQISAYLISLFSRELAGVSTVFIPIFLEICQSFQVNPLYIGLPVTLVLSYGFMSRTNVLNILLLETGHITLKDTAFSGFFMNLAAFVLVILNMNTYAYWILGLDQVPTTDNVSMNCTN